MAARGRARSRWAPAAVPRGGPSCRERRHGYDCAMSEAMTHPPIVPARVPALSYFFPAHNEEANLDGLVQEALSALPALADRFEIIIVDDGSKDRTPQLADALAAANPDVVRVVHHPTNLGYGAALRSGFRAASTELVAFTDGDRQFRVADLGRLTARLSGPDAPDAVVGYLSLIHISEPTRPY